MSQHTATITANCTSAKGTHYVVTLDGEVVGTRTSPRVYRSAVVVVNAKKGPGVYAYAGTEQLAQNRMGEVRKGYPTEPVIIARWAEPTTDAEPSTEAAPAPEPKPTRSSAKPKKPAPAAKAKALGLVGQRLDMPAQRIVGFVAMEVHKETPFGGDFAECGHAAGAGLTARPATTRSCGLRSRRRRRPLPPRSGGRPARTGSRRGTAR